VRQVVDGHSDQLTHAGINVVIETVPVTALADSTKLSRAVANLLDNAIRYAPGSRLLVQVCPEPDDILLRLTDSGPGWPEQDPSALLDPFARGETSRSRDTGGAGLGLAIVQAIVTAHEGRISLSHSPDTGAIVEIRIPSA
jgi:signal transduction histidine kinase